MTKKEKQIRKFFEKYGNLIESVEEAQELYERIYASATGGTITLDGSGYSKGGKQGSIVESSVCLMDDLEEGIEEKAKEAEKIKGKLEDLILLIPAKDIQKVMTMLYIQRMDRVDVSREVKRSIRTVMRKRNEGISAIAKKLN